MAESTTGATPGMISDAFTFWTNKGGVGKTTMCFHSATAFAATHPNVIVVAIDMDPQANLSSTMLTQVDDMKDIVNGKDALSRVEGDASYAVHVGEGRSVPRTLLGYLMGQVTRDLNIDIGEFILDAREFNSNLPPNLKLLSGDTRLNCIEDEFQRIMCSGTNTSHATPWRDGRRRLRKSLEEYAAQYPGKETVLFFDTNPSLTIWTQIALVSSNKLMIPVMADEFSKAALRNMIYLLHGLGRATGDVGRYENSMFFHKAREYEVPIPLIHGIIFNKCVIKTDKLIKGFKALEHQQYDVLKTLMQDCADADIDLARVFSDYDGGIAPHDLTREMIAEKYGCWMRDMHTAGVVTMRCGLPFWQVKRNKKSVAAIVEEASYSVSLQSSLRDFVKNDHSDDDQSLRTPVLQMLVRGRPEIPDERIKSLLNEGAMSASAAKRARTMPPAPPPPVNDGDDDPLF